MSIYLLLRIFDDDVREDLVVTKERLEGADHRRLYHDTERFVCLDDKI